jgi:hypothetical protein
MRVFMSILSIPALATRPSTALDDDYEWSGNNGLITTIGLY